MKMSQKMKNYDTGEEKEFLTDAGAMQALLDGKRIQVFCANKWVKGTYYKLDKRRGLLVNRLGDQDGPWYNRVFGEPNRRWITL